MSAKAHVRRNNSNNDSGVSGLDQPDSRKEKPKVSLKKKKMKNNNSRLGADVVRCVELLMLFTVVVWYPLFYL